jgi:hypothetical protein
MTLQEFKNQLNASSNLNFALPNGKLIPQYFHITEVGKETREFIDCGGTLRKEVVVNFQLWCADDYDHRLKPNKLLNIIRLSEKKLDLNPESTVEVEYQGSTIETYQLGYDNGLFRLIVDKTDCLAKDQCGIPQDFQNDVNASEKNVASCSPESNCC